MSRVESRIQTLRQHAFGTFKHSSYAAPMSKYLNTVIGAKAACGKFTCGCIDAFAGV